MSSEAGPTPGPWSVGDKDMFDDVLVIPTNEPMRTIAVALHFEEGREDNNAHLIAAAPDLLEAAKELLDACKDHDDFWDPEQGFVQFVERMEQAINRAEGHG